MNTYFNPIKHLIKTARCLPASFTLWSYCRSTAQATDTRSLSMRFGLHSGSVLGGVLMGSCARFQLFGETVNMAKKIERYVKT